MESRPVFGVELDICPRCRGVFFDANEPEMAGVDTAALFGVGAGAATRVGADGRPCPAHGQPMVRYRIVATDGRALDVDRAACCGGVFLDAGEQSHFAAAAERAARLAGAPPVRPSPIPSPSPSSGAAGDNVRTSTGAVFAAPPPPPSSTPGGHFGDILRGVVAHEPRSVAPLRELDPTEASDRACPRCRGPYRADRADGLEVDYCAACGSMFFDPGESEAAGAHTAAFFGVGPSAAQAAGPSELSCPACGPPMEAWRVSTLAGVLEVDRAGCCGGLYLDGGELDPFVRASRAAHHAEADARYATDGEVAGERAMIRSMASGPTLSAVTASVVRGRVDAMVMTMLRRRHRRDHHSH